MKENGRFGWYVTFVLIAVAAFIGIHALTGQDALAAAARFIWNAFALTFNAIARVLGSLVGLLARGVGWRRLSRIANVIAGIGIGYAASVVLSDEKVQRARTWRGRLRMMVAIARNRWQALPLFWKLAVVAVLIASQIYVHTILIVFPIAFLVPVVRRLWVRVADLAFGSWYWRKFGSRHRTIIARLRALPGIRAIIGWGRLTRIRYLTAWRLWRHHPRYRLEDSNRRRVSFIEPLRLWRRGELDGYIGKPLLAGCKAGSCCACDGPDGGQERGWTTPSPSITLTASKPMIERDA